MKDITKYSDYKESEIEWLNYIPRHWKEIKAKRIFIERSEKCFPDEPLLAATQTKGVIPKSLYEKSTVTAQKNFETLKLVRKGDFVISLRSFQGGIEFAHYQGIISPAYTILEPKEMVVDNYYRYLLKSKHFISGLTLLVTGIREGQNIDTAKFKDSYLLLPPKEEQTSIARFLDFKLSKIDRFIRKKKSLIKLLNEQKAGIINQAVTKGVPNRTPSAAEASELVAKWSVNAVKICDGAVKRTDIAADTCDTAAKWSDTAVKSCDAAAKWSVNAAETCDAAANRSVNVAETCDAAARWSVNAVETCDVEANRLDNAAKTCVVEAKRSVKAPETTNVPMKPSGIEWLGDIPEHWEVKKLKYSVRLNQHKIFDKEESSFNKIALENIESKTGRLLSTGENSFDGVGTIFKKGDVLFGKLRPYLAKVITCELEGHCVNEILVISPNNNVWVSDFLKSRMLSPDFIKVVNDSTYGSKMPRASWSFIGGLKVGCPSLQEQNSILDYIDRETAQINSIISTIEKEISLVQEYRTALIAEAVTGKIDVRDYPIPVGWEQENEELINEELMDEELINEGVEE
ncbi:MAG: restriction endonuclease subunit S [Mariniphaga sp.]